MPRHLIADGSLGELLSHVQSFLASKVSTFISVVAATTSLASLAGWASFGAAVASFLWMVLQIFNYFTFTLPHNLRERERQRQLEELRDQSQPVCLPSTEK